MTVIIKITFLTLILMQSARGEHEPSPWVLQDCINVTAILSFEGPKDNEVFDTSTNSFVVKDSKSFCNQTYSLLFLESQTSTLEFHFVTEYETT